MQSCNGLLSWEPLSDDKQNWNWQQRVIVISKIIHVLRLFPHLALQNCTCKTAHLCHSCSHLNCMLLWYLQGLTVLAFFYPFICADIPLQIKHSAVCTNVQALVDIQPCTTENPTENVPTFMSYSEVYERKGACLHTFHYCTGSIREWRWH